MAPDHPLSTSDALAILLVATEAMTTVLQDDHPDQLRRGAVLLYDQMMLRVRPILQREFGRDPSMSHVFEMVERARGLAADVRAIAGLPVVV